MKIDFVPFYTPSLIDAEDLERLFVGRDQLVRSLLGLIKESAETTAKHYTLLIGPRGIGKTTMLTLVHHHLQHDSALLTRLRVAWLREDEWGIGSYLDLLMVILRTLKEQDSSLITEIDSLYLMSRVDAERQAEQVLLDSLNGRTLLVLMENLDRIFDGLGKDGQHSLRAFLQNHRVCTILATTPSLFNAISRRNLPFYGFFRLYPLEELTCDEAVEMLRKYAMLRGDTPLVEFLDTPQGQGRVRVIHLLTGGNHRVFAILTQCLTLDKLQALVEAMLHIIDELTPYYQARMEQLPPQQRKIVEFLAEHGKANPPKEIAFFGFMSQQTVGKQLNELHEKGFVIPNVNGRETWYELREPLMRLCVEVKKTRGGNQPIRLIVEFLKGWYTHEELITWVRSIKPSDLTDTVRVHIVAVLEEMNAEVQQELDKRRQELDEENRIVKIYKKQISLLEEYGEAIEHSDFVKALTLTEEMLSNLDDANTRLFHVDCLCNLGRYEDALIAMNAALEIYQHDVNLLYLKAKVLSALDSGAESVMVLKQLLEIDPKYSNAWNDLGIALFELGRYEEALAAVENAIGLGCHGDPELGRAIILLRLHRVEESLQVYKSLLESAEDKYLDAIVEAPIHTIPAILSPMVSESAAERMAEGWRELVGEHEAFIIPLRILAAAVNYRKAKNERDRMRALLQLPSEERIVLKETINSATEE